jgi:hypothetical protein
MAIACFRLVTFLPLRPDFSLPFFMARISRSTDLPADLPYLRPDDFFDELFLELLFFEELFFDEDFFAGLFFAALFFLVAIARVFSSTQVGTRRAMIGVAARQATHICKLRMFTAF